MLTRRQFLIRSALLACWPTGCVLRPSDRTAPVVNDIQSQLNATRVARIEKPDSIEDLQRMVRAIRAERKAISIVGGRHAMGGQQFAEDAVLLDMNRLNHIVGFDAQRGLIEVEAGIQWPELFEHLLRVQEGRWPQWGIIQKQTGADRLSIGGALSANVHGRGLRLKPFIADVEAFTLVDANGTLHRCSRTENSELFRLAIGGYGLFGVIATTTLRLMRRVKIERVVEVIESKDLMAVVDRRIADGFLYGDLQYATDHASEDFLRKGVFSCYRPVNDATPIPDRQKELSAENWRRLYYLAHADKSRAFKEYTEYYLSTSGQIYWSDIHQLSLYFDDYHRALDQRLHSVAKGTEMITEIYVPRPSLVSFLEEVRREFRNGSTEIIYGTIRLIEQDDESFLAWAREPWACTIFNLHVDHTPTGIERAASAFRLLIDLAVRYGGSYYLTYHRWATRQQVGTCYPQFVEFLKLKRKYDPDERFQSEWYRHYKTMFADAL